MLTDGLIYSVRANLNTATLVEHPYYTRNP